MVVDATGSSTSAAQSASASAAKKTGLDYDNFLKLLIAQMKNQDPTDPIDSTDQIAQLATFSQVEQTIQTNKNLEKLIQGTNLNQASSMIGRTLTSSDGLTTGVVKEVRVLSDGLRAVLQNGSEVEISAGVRIS